VARLGRRAGGYRRAVCPGKLGGFPGGRPGAAAIVPGPLFKHDAFLFFPPF
jgi:hypothetical protein